MNTSKLLPAASNLKSQKYCNLHYKAYSLSIFVTLSLFTINTNVASAQGYATGYGAFGAGGSINSVNPGNGQYYGATQAHIDNAILKGNREMLRSDVDYEDYLLQKRTAFAQQIQQNDLAEEKLRTYAEQRLKTLGTKGKSLSVAEQAESHDLMDWLKKDAAQRANNLAWLKRQDSEIAMAEQDQDVSFKNQRNSLHNMFEDNLNVQSQYKWNQQMQLANLHLAQNRQGAVSWGRPPQDGLSNIGLNRFGAGLGVGFNGQRWGN
jgi:hypothetical protein